MPRRLVLPLLLGMLLNPLNSSMIAVALVTLREDFDVTLVTVTWLISGFYLAAAVGQPLAGRLADLIGPKHVFCAGWILVGISGVIGPLAPSFGWLLVARVLTALGTACAFPAGMAILRREAVGDAPPPSTLGAINVANATSAALGPVLGGLLVVTTGWEGIFAVNAVLAAGGLPWALRALPADPPRPAQRRQVTELLDVGGIGLFLAGLGGVLGFVLSLGDPSPRWWLLPVGLAGLAGLAWWERRARTPLLELAVILDRRLLAVFVQYAAVNVVFYSAFFAVPQWLEDARGYGAGTAGLLILPIAGVGVLVTPLAARVVARRGPRPALLIGSTFLTLGSAVLLVVGDATPVAVIVVAAAILGVPGGFNNLGLQSALYAAAPPASTGAAAGLFQTFRFFGAIGATALIGLALGDPASSAGLHGVAAVTLAIAVLLVLAGLRERGRRPARPA